MRKVFVSLLICLLANLVISTDNSDLRFAINTKIIQFHSIHIGKDTFKTPIVSEADINSKFAHVQIFNGTLTDIETPNEIVATGDAAKSVLNLSINELTVKLNFEKIHMSSLKLIKKNFKNLEVDVVLKEVLLSLEFKGDKINVVDLKFKAHSIRLKVKSAFTNVILLSVSEVAKLEINKSQKKMKKQVQKLIDDDLNKDFKVSLKKIKETLDLKITDGLQLVFPKSKSMQFLEDQSQSTFITLGLTTKFSLTENLEISEVKSNTPFPEGTWTRSGALLVFDSLINNFINTYQTTSKLDILVDQSKAGSSLPFNLDSEGLQVILPELRFKFPNEPKEAAIRIWLGPKTDECYVKVGTSNEGVLIRASFHLDIQIKNDKNELETVFGSIIHLKIKANAIIDKDNISLSVFYLGLVDTPIEINNTLGTKVNLEVFGNNITNLLNVALMTTPIPVLNPNSLLKEKGIPLEVSKIDIDHNDDYTSLIFDAVYKKIQE